MRENVEKFAWFCEITQKRAWFRERHVFCPISAFLRENSNFSLIAWMRENGKKICLIAWLGTPWGPLNTSSPSNFGCWSSLPSIQDGRVRIRIVLDSKGGCSIIFMAALVILFSTRRTFIHCSGCVIHSHYFFYRQLFLKLFSLCLYFLSWVPPWIPITIPGY